MLAMTNMDSLMPRAQGCAGAATFTAALAGFDANLEHTLEALRPEHRRSGLTS